MHGYLNHMHGYASIVKDALFLVVRARAGGGLAGVGYLVEPKRMVD
jgi:hypothetical protein